MCKRLEPFSSNDFIAWGGTWPGYRTETTNLQQQMHRRIELDRSDHELDNRLKLFFFVFTSFTMQRVFIFCHRVAFAWMYFLVVWCTDDISCSLGFFTACRLWNWLRCLSHWFSMLIFVFFSLSLSPSFVFVAINWLVIISIKFTFVVTFYHYNRE